MDDFVCGKLSEWGLGKYIPIFKENQVDEESLFFLQEEDMKELIKDIGPKAKFRKCLKKLKEEEAEAHAQGSTRTTSSRGKRKLDDSDPEQEVEPVHCGGNVSPPPKKSCSVLPTFCSQAIKETLETDEKELSGAFDKTEEWKFPSGEEKLPPGEEKLTPGEEKLTPVEEKLTPGEEKLPPGEEKLPPSEKELEESVWSTHDDDDEIKQNLVKMAVLFGSDWDKEPYETFKEKYRNISNAIKEKPGL